MQDLEEFMDDEETAKKSVRTIKFKNQRS
jgi:hypothetical protein